MGAGAGSGVGSGEYDDLGRGVCCDYFPFGSG